LRRKAYKSGDPKGVAAATVLLVANTMRMSINLADDDPDKPTPEAMVKFNDELILKARTLAELIPERRTALLNEAECLRDEVAAMPQQTAPAAPAGPQPDEQVAQEVKKTALVRELQGEWPSIEKDLSEASRNGLAAARVRHGFWDVQKVKDWGKSRGKLSKPATVHPLGAPWPGQVTRHRAGD